MAKFHFVLIAAVATMAIFGFYGGSDYAERGWSRAETDEFLVETDFGNIGDFETSYRNIFERNRLDVSYESPNKTVEQFDDLTVRNGFPGEKVSRTVDFEAYEPEAVYVKFTVESSKPYGDFELGIDGELKESFEPEEGVRHTVKLEDIEEGRSTLMLSAEPSPQHVFWSPTEYKLSNVEIILEDRAVEKNTETFRVYDYEVSSFDKGELEFYVREDIQDDVPLTIDINGNTVFERQPKKRAHSYETTFSMEETDIRPGENSISIYSEPGANYRLENFVADLHYYTTTDRITVETDFELPIHQYQFLGENQGRIEYYVEKVGVAEDLEISLPNRDFVENPSTGWNRLTFSKEDVKRGSNTVQLTTSGNYRINKFRVFLD